MLLRARRSFLKHRSGAGMGEYALIAALVAGVSALAVASLGGENRDVFQRIALATQEAGSGAPGQGAPQTPQPGVPGENFAITLGAASLPQANRLSPWSFDFSSLVAFQDPGTVSLADLAWSGGEPVLPSWMNLDPQTGVASGTPDLEGQTSFEVVASYMGADGRQVFVLDVGGEIVEVVQIAAGESHTCAVTASGAALCWGANNSGQLGDGTTTQRLTPVGVSGLESGVASIAPGGAHTCAVTTSGAALCWGRNSNGALGDGTTTDRHTPVSVSGLESGVASIAGWGWHTCAVTTTGAARCWGVNSHGQLGDGTIATRHTPVNVSGLEDGVESIAAGPDHTCAVTAAGAALCWGSNSHGQLGDSTTTQRRAPVNVSGLNSGVASIAVGWQHTCAVTAAGAAMCWGRGARLGDGATADRHTPVSVTNLESGVASIAAGQSHTCAVTTTGAAKCWGSNLSGQLGDRTGTHRLAPVSVSGLYSGVASIAAGHSHTCAATTSGGAMCWGRNTNGQLGDGTTTERYAPIGVVF